MPIATHKITPYLNHKDRSTPPTMIVMHGTAGGSLSGAVETLRDRELSYSYLIDRKGRIYKGTPADSYAYHAGSSYGPEHSARKVSRAQYPNTKPNRLQNRVGKFVAGVSVNATTFGISFVNKEDGSEPLTREQITAAVALVKELKAAYPTIEYVTTHAQVSPGRKFDPRMLDLDDFAALVDLRAFKWGD